MKVVILAGGKGTRLAPYTAALPKPLVPVGDMPIIEILVRQLAHFGFTDITLSIGHLGELIQAYFAARPLPRSVRLAYVTEHEPRGTAGSLRLVGGLDQPFLVMNGDVLTTIDFNGLVQFHRDQGATLTIAMHDKEVQTDLGVIELGEDGKRVTGYREKPVLGYLVSMGIYVYDPSALPFIPPQGRFDFPDLVLALLAAKRTVAGYRSADFWLDIGRHADYEQATAEFEANRADFHVD